MVLKKRRFYKKRRASGRKRRTRRRTTRTKRKNARAYPHNVFSMRMPGMPQRIFTKLHYAHATVFTIDTTAAGPLSNYKLMVFQSSARDPEYALGGHSPMFYDKYTANYNKYRVLGFSYRFEITNVNTNQLMPFMIWTGSTGASIVGAGFKGWLAAEEQPDTRVVKVGGVGTSTTVVRGYVPVYKSLGVTKKEVMTDDRFSALVTADPQQCCYVHLYGSSMNVSASNQANIRIKLIYYVEFYDLKTSGMVLNDQEPTPIDPLFVPSPPEVSEV